VESSCELDNEPSGSIKCWELPNGCTICGLSSGTQLHRVSYLILFLKLLGLQKRDPKASSGNGFRAVWSYLQMSIFGYISAAFCS
jgi:hypothetical protein